MFSFISKIIVASKKRVKNVQKIQIHKKLLDVLIYSCEMVILINMVMSFTCVTFAYVKPIFISYVYKANDPLAMLDIAVCFNTINTVNVCKKELIELSIPTGHGPD